MGDVTGNTRYYGPQCPDTVTSIGAECPVIYDRRSDFPGKGLAVVGEHGKAGRPRSAEARAAILHAVDDLVAEVGYGAVSMKSIAERAGVSRQTVYRWWSTKAEVLLEASASDAREELAVITHDDPIDDLAAYLDALIAFLSASAAGSAYRALVGEAQHDQAVEELLRGNDLLGESAATVIARALPGEALVIPLSHATAHLVGPVFYWILSGRDPGSLDAGAILVEFLQLAAPTLAR